MIKRNLLVMGLAVLAERLRLSAARHRHQSELSITELDVTARNAYGDTVRELRQVLENSGVKVTAAAPYHLVLTDEQDSQRAASYAGNGGSVEYRD
jgi:LPS-assembly lipoprotein